MVRVLREREFRLLWFGQSASTIGDRLVFVALALYVTEIGTPTDVGIVLAAHAIPFVACLMLGGVWADRLPRHRVMIATDLIRAAMHALLAALIFTGAVEIWHIVVIEAVFGAAEAFFRPAFTGLVPQTVPESMLQEANAATSVVQTVAEFAGPALATALVLGVGAGWAFALDAATFIVSAAFLVRMRPRARGAIVPGDTLLAELRAGWAEFRARAWVWGTVAIFCVMLLVAFAPYTVLGPTVAEEVYDSRGLYGTLAAALGLGTIVGARDRLPLAAGAAAAGRVRGQPAVAAGDRAVRGRRAAAAARRRCSSPPAPAWRCSTCGGRRRSRSGSRRTRCRACPRTTGWARWRCCRSATCSRVRSARRWATSRW